MKVLPSSQDKLIWPRSQGELDVQLPKSEMMAILKSCMLAIGVPTHLIHLISLHGLRTGGTCDLRDAGTATTDIMAHGRWSPRSLSILHYNSITPDTSENILKLDSSLMSMPDFKVDRGRTMTENKLNQILNGIHSCRINDTFGLSNDVNNACLGSFSSLDASPPNLSSSSSSLSLSVRTTPDVCLLEPLPVSVTSKRSRLEYVDVSDVESVTSSITSSSVSQPTIVFGVRSKIHLSSASSDVQSGQTEDLFWSSSPVVVSRSGRTHYPTKRHAMER